jgi:hypothetical protein
MREITSHHVNPANDKIRITVLDEPGSGGACHVYLVTGMDMKNNPGADVPMPAWAEDLTPMNGQSILFQNGPIAEAGVNGITHEALLAILIDRLTAFQAGPFANHFNGSALQHLHDAQEELKARTRVRMARGVEGMHIV